MSIGVLIVITLVVVSMLLAVGILFDIPGFRAGGAGSAKNSMRAIVNAQRQNVPGAAEGMPSQFGRSKRSVIDSAEDSRVMMKAQDSKLTIKKRLKYAQWPITPPVFHLMEAGVAIIAFIFFALFMKLNIVAQVFTLTIGPLFMRWLLSRRVEKRFQAFDTDYAPFLLSLVGLLKTGMNAMGAIEAAAQGLEEGSMMKTEVELMLERLRYGVPEDASIGSFGEDINHPEIELFVQALLLSKRVGGTLSDTLDRLAKQVRKRQYFRKQAIAAVGMQRGSIWFIILIMVALEVYLYFIYPVAVTGAINDPMGWQVWQGGVGLVLIGMWWVRQVTKIKV
jgi:tight adherence protein B